MSQITEINEHILTKILKIDEFYEALWGKEDFTPEAIITVPNDYNCGALANPLEYVYEFIRQITGQDLDDLPEPYIDIVVFFFTGFQRFDGEGNADLIRRMESVLIREADWRSERFGTPWDIKNVFAYYLDRSLLYYIPNTVLTDLLINGDFELAISGEWVFDPSGDRSQGDAFTGDHKLDFTAFDSVTQTLAVTSGSYILNSFVKPIEGASRGIYQAYTNLVQDPTDLTTANWSNSNSTDEISTLSINGNLFTKVINVGANAGFVQQVFTTSFSNLILTGSVTIKKGNSSGNTTRFGVFNNTGGVYIFNTNIDWDNFGSSPGTPSHGSFLDYDWIDSETLKIYYRCITLDFLTDDIRVVYYGSNNATDGEYTYWSEVQLIDSSSITLFPFVNGTHVADIINETFTMPDKFAIRLQVTSKFAYDTIRQHHFLNWYISGSLKLSLQYLDTSDDIRLVWQDGTFSVLSSTAFNSDGSGGLIKLNQKLDIIVLVDVISADINGSSLIIIEEDGTIHIDDVWNVIPDVKSSDFSTLSIGHAVGVFQADSEYESLQVFNWDGVKSTITSSEDADTYFEDKEILFDTSTFNMIAQRDSDSNYYNTKSLAWQASLPDNKLSLSGEDWELAEYFIINDGSYNIDITFSKIVPFLLDHVEFGEKLYPAFELLFIDTGSAVGFASAWGVSTEYQNASYTDQDFLFESAASSYSDTYYQSLLDTLAGAGIKGIFNREIRS